MSLSVETPDAELERLQAVVRGRFAWLCLLNDSHSQSPNEDLREAIVSAERQWRDAKDKLEAYRAGAK